MSRYSRSGMGTLTSMSMNPEASGVGDSGELYYFRRSANDSWQLRVGRRARMCFTTSMQVILVFRAG